jgi:hypothetical protein
MAWGTEQEARGQQLSEEVMTGLRDWRAAHPRAPFAEREAVGDERLNRMRARMLKDLAWASAAASAAQTPGACPEGGQALQRRGPQTRTLTVQGDQPVHWRRRCAVCPACGTGLFPPG